MILVPFLTALNLMSSPAPCAPDTLLLLTGDDQHQFSARIADTLIERTIGLMGSEPLEKDETMLFVYAEPGSRTFWMKNVSFSLDLLFIDATGTITEIVHRAEPYDPAPITSAKPAQFVLEITGGLSVELGLQSGDKVLRQMINGSTKKLPCLSKPTTENPKTH